MSCRELLQQRRDQIIAVAARHGARNVRVIGSVVRREDNSSSDIDLLVDLDLGRSLLDHAALIAELQALLGRKVDVATERGLRPAVRARVVPEAELL
jgi:predicted nucleotidyltransferase